MADAPIHHPDVIPSQQDQQDQAWDKADARKREERVVEHAEGTLRALRVFFGKEFWSDV